MRAQRLCVVCPGSGADFETRKSLVNMFDWTVMKKGVRRSAKKTILSLDRLLANSPTAGVMPNSGADADANLSMSPTQELDPPVRTQVDLTAESPVSYPPAIEWPDHEQLVDAAAFDFPSQDAPRPEEDIVNSPPTPPRRPRATRRRVIESDSEDENVPVLSPSPPPPPHMAARKYDPRGKKARARG